MIVYRSRIMHPKSPPLTIGGTVLKESDDLDILGVIFDSEMTLRRILSRFPEQILKYLVSWGGPVEYSIEYWEMLSWFLSCQFWSTVLWCGARCRYTPKITEPCGSGAWFLTAVVFECNIAHRLSVAVLCMMYTIRCNPRHSLYGALPLPCVQARLTRGALVAHRHAYICASSLQNLTVSHDFYFPLSVSVERSCWLCIRSCWTGGF